MCTSAQYILYHIIYKQKLTGVFFGAYGVSLHEAFYALPSPSADLGLACEVVSAFEGVHAARLTLSKRACVATAADTRLLHYLGSIYI